MDEFGDGAVPSCLSISWPADAVVDVAVICRWIFEMYAGQGDTEGRACGRVTGGVRELLPQSSIKPRT